MQRDIESVIRDILGTEQLPDTIPAVPSGLRPVDQCLREFAGLLAKDSTEEAVQRFFTNHPQIILGLVGYAEQSQLALLTKPAVGSRYNADFTVLDGGQHGIAAHLVELKLPSAKPFQRSGNESVDLGTAIRQTRDRSIWIEENWQTFLGDTLEHAARMPMYPKRHRNGSFLISEISYYRQTFQLLRTPTYTSTIVIGCWSRLSDLDKRRLQYINRNSEYKVVTYEQLFRRACARPLRY